MAASLNRMPTMNLAGLVVETAPVSFRRYLLLLISINPYLSIFCKGVYSLTLNLFLVAPKISFRA